MAIITYVREKVGILATFTMEIVVARQDGEITWHRIISVPVCETFW